MDKDALSIEIQTKLYKKKLQNWKLIDLLKFLDTDTLFHLSNGIDNIKLAGEEIPKALYIFTDGACSKNGKVDAKASWACFITDNEDSKYSNLNMSGIIEKNGTNQKAELTAILNALEMLDAYQKSIDEKDIIICSDSMYSINCCTKWYKAWEKNNWKNAKNQDVKNPEIIKKIIQCLKKLNAKFNITFKHVYSHTSEPKNKDSFDYFVWYGNDSVDKMATKLL